MGKRSDFSRFWRKIPQTVQPFREWLASFHDNLVQYGKPRYWLIYIVAFGLGFYLFGPAHGWQNMQRNSRLRHQATVKPDSIATLQQEVAILKKNLQQLADQTEKKTQFTPELFSKPAAGKVGQGYQWVLKDKIWRLHPGVEIKLPAGSNVMAAADGTVLGSDNTEKGFTITIDHGNGWSTIYAQLKQSMVHKGETVSKGQVIGNSGISQCVAPEQPGFHFGIYHEKEPVDPEKIISGLK
ncbi:MAG TPA: M23 family metallopeptidase [Bacillota bacterium]|nr:M23 family metallopeptidase [Bacillota bacterium]